MQAVADGVETPDMSPLATAHVPNDVMTPTKRYRLNKKMQELQQEREYQMLLAENEELMKAISKAKGKIEALDAVKGELMASYNNCPRFTLPLHLLAYNSSLNALQTKKEWPQESKTSPYMFGLVLFIILLIPLFLGTPGSVQLQRGATHRHPLTEMHLNRLHNSIYDEGSSNAQGQLRNPLYVRKLMPFAKLREFQYQEQEEDS